MYLGLAWSLGCLVFGLLVVRRGAECSVSRHYLTQAASILAGTAIMAFTQVYHHLKQIRNIKIFKVMKNISI